MDKIPDIINKKIEIFLDLLEKNGINIQKAYLFGSYVNGKPDQWSDIDLALISDKFKGNKYDDIMLLSDYILQAGRDISPLPFRLEDFENSIFARDEIVKKGIAII